MANYLMLEISLKIKHCKLKCLLIEFLENLRNKYEKPENTQNILTNLIYILKTFEHLSSKLISKKFIICAWRVSGLHLVYSAHHRQQALV